jgi:N-acetylmuramoyl-L-alanine amidase
MWVPPGRTAHHVRGYNARSIGVELVNLGRYPDWYASDRVMTEAYAEAQLLALDGLLTALGVMLPSLRWIAGHEDLDSEWVPASDDPARRVRRKLDPGPLFPWGRVMDGTKLQRFEPEGN